MNDKQEELAWIQRKLEDIRKKQKLVPLQSI